MKEFIEYLIKNLVDKPELVEIKCDEEQETFVVEIKVAPEEVGKVIGRNGATIQALRTIAKMASARIGRRVRLFLAHA